MNVTDSRKLTMSGFYSDLSSTIDGAILFVVPVASASIEAIEWGLDDGGTTSGSTGITVKRVRAETDASIVADADEDTIDHDATTLYSTIKSTLHDGYKRLVYGDIVRIDVDTVTGGTDSAGLTVALILNVDRD